MLQAGTILIGSTCNVLKGMGCMYNPIPDTIPIVPPPPPSKSVQLYTSIFALHYMYTSLLWLDTGHSPIAILEKSSLQL